MIDDIAAPIDDPVKSEKVSLPEYIITFKWMSKNFMIRAFIILFWVIVFLRIRAGGIDNELVGIVVAQLTGMIGLKTAEKIFIKKRRKEREKMAVKK